MRYLMCKNVYGAYLSYDTHFSKANPITQVSLANTYNFTEQR